MRTIQKDATKTIILNLNYGWQRLYNIGCDHCCTLTCPAGPLQQLRKKSGQK